MANDNKTQMNLLVQKLEKRGFTVVKNDGHFQVKKPDGTRLTTLPGTPSDRRSVDNAYAELRRLGVDVRKHDNKKKGSIDDFALGRLRERMEVQLKRVNRSELARLCQHVAVKKHIAPFGSVGSGELLIKRVMSGEGRITKSNHNLLAATLNVMESSDEKALDKHVKAANERAGIERGRRHHHEPVVKKEDSGPLRKAVEDLLEDAIIPIEVPEEPEAPVTGVTEIKHVIELRIPPAERSWLRELILAVLETRGDKGYGW